MIFLPVLGLCFLLFVAFLLTEKGKKTKSYLKFIITGLDTGFKFSDIRLLAKIGKSTGLEDISLLYWSLPVLDSCTQALVLLVKKNGNENDPKIQNLLSMLYAYRTKLELEQSKKKIGLTSTRELHPGQKIRIVLKGVGIYSSSILKNNGTNLMIEFPKNPASSNMPSATSISWVGKAIVVYFWKAEDAGYEFETSIIQAPESATQFHGKAVLFITHSRSFVRTQKRRSIRAKCNIYAQLYILPSEADLNTALEAESGMKCLIEDISEDGAMILIGGKAIEKMLIKLQFMLNDVLIVMAGYSKGFQYNQDKNQSRIHFESIDVMPRMKNAILAYVYNVLPEEEKHDFEALRLSEEDEKEGKDTSILESGFESITEIQSP